MIKSEIVFIILIGIIHLSRLDNEDWIQSL